MATLGELVEQLRDLATADLSPGLLMDAADRLAALDALMPALVSLAERDDNTPICDCLECSDRRAEVLHDLLALR